MGMEKHLFQGVGRLSQSTFVKALGSTIQTSTGQKLLDFTSQIGVTNTGHCHPLIVQAAKDQMDDMIMSQVNLGYHKPMLDLTDELLNRVLPSQLKDLNRVFYGTTGAEAVENAVKLAKYSTGRDGVIVFQGGYHGRTALTMAMTTSSVIYKQHMGSNPANVYTLPFPYELHGKSVEECLNDLKLFFQQQSHPQEIAAMVIEPVLGEGGYVPTPPTFMKGLRDSCNEHGILLIADEVQTGFGRTGEILAMNHCPDVQPDIMVLAKGLASGFPLSAVIAKSELADSQVPGTMGGTYAGNAVACAAALATQRVIRDEGLVDNAKVQGARLTKGLIELKDQYPDVIRDVRGLGCMIGLEFHQGHGVPDGINKLVSQACFDNGMLLLPASVFPTVRFIPPLTVSDQEVDMGLDIFEKSLKDVLGSNQ